MKLVRVWFQKKNTARYISHLDLNRCISRAFQKAKIPLWYTQGFNPHPFLTFALPLSLGITGVKESMDIKLQEEISVGELIRRLNGALPDDIHVYDVTEPKMKPGQIAYASFVLRLDGDGDCAALAESITGLLRREEIIVPKRSKSGTKDVNIRPWLDRVAVKLEGDTVRIDAVLPAGSVENVNPGLLLDAMERYLERRPFVQITRTNLYDKDLQVFA